MLGDTLACQVNIISSSQYFFALSKKDLGGLIPINKFKEI
jgi:hypothetical protein